MSDVGTQRLQWIAEETAPLPNKRAWQRINELLGPDFAGREGEAVKQAIWRERRQVRRERGIRGGTKGSIGGGW
jgi:hypothetical protein